MIKNNKLKWILFFVFHMITQNIFCQNDSIKSHIIITFEQDFKNSPHSKKTYNWIINSSNITNTKLEMSILVLGGFSNQDIINCSENEKTNPDLVFPDSTYDFNQEQLNEIVGLEQLINKNKRKIQAIKKKWSTGQTEKITVYATAVKGIFCYTEYLQIDEDAYSGLIYLPLSTFSKDGEFWCSNNSKYVLTNDFSKMNFVF